MSADADGDAVDPEEVKYIAELARVQLSDAEAERFTEQFADILTYFETLDEVPDFESEPELTNVMRPDDPEEGLSQEEALQNAPATEDGYFKGPPVS
ncbi:Asp-tRNA(Asn)/Glu-tRNA(Gln) amidotransferase GatCAB subunit C [Halobacteriales archaeon QH_10_67_13]|nr:MAG: Asp-tRNA(Asn)/Glu-tRNA(Gln) amidotransferase GatCAB subunit C [Halobacteriales archaeon QH_10_67_13]